MLGQGNDLLNEERRCAILELLQRETRVPVADLTQQGSDLSSHRDLDALHVRQPPKHTRRQLASAHDPSYSMRFHEKERLPPPLRAA
jgi:DeoR/GlpR family transcriptional regulator of sugar metabolism